MTPAKTYKIFAAEIHKINVDDDVCIIVEDYKSKTFTICCIWYVVSTFVFYLPKSFVQKICSNFQFNVHTVICFQENNKIQGMIVFCLSLC